MKTSLFSSMIAIAVLGAAFSGNASAALIASYRSDDMSVYQPLGAFDWHNDISKPTDMNRVGTEWTGPSGWYSFNQWGASIDMSQYVGFKVSAGDGEQLSLVSLTGTNSAAYDGATSFVWGYRIDANNDNVFEQGWIFGQTYTTADAGFGNVTVAKDWVFDQAVVTQGTVEFGFFASAANAGSTAEPFRGVMTLNGDVTAVPEPSTYALMLAAGAAGLIFARRRATINS